MSTKKKIATIVITTVALTAGTVGVSSAATKATKASISRVSTSATAVKGPRGLDLTATLSALVAKGTITQAQADAIVAAANAAKAAADALKPAKPDHAATLALISTTIGVDSATIQNRLAAGETLAAIAGAKKDALIAALVADETKRIDAAVTAGKLTAAQATTLKANLTAHVTEEVNSTRPLGGKGGFGHKGGKGGHGPKGGVAGTSTLTLPATPTA
jgi:polyhydroxyalkanoate synthesis regulator phasin